MSGFTEAHIEEESKITGRGLQPCRVQFLLGMHKLKVPKPFHDKVIVITCEKETDMTASAPKRKSESSEDEFFFDEQLHLYTVVAQRDVICSSSECGHPPLPKNDGDETVRYSYERTTVRITVRQNSVHGIVLDCVCINLSEYLCGGPSTSTATLQLQLGGTLSMTIAARVFNRAEDAEVVHDHSRMGLANEMFCDENDFEVVEIESASEYSDKSNLEYAIGADTVRQCSEDDAIHDELEAVHYSSSDEDGCPFGINEICDTADAGLGGAAPTQITTVSKSVSGSDDKDERAGSSNERNEGDAIEDEPSENAMTIRDMKYTRRAGEEYRTVYSGGTWVEDASILEMQAPNKILFWSIDGPEEYESDDEEDSGTEGLPKRRNVMVVSTTKPGPPAAPGRLSRLQKSVMTFEEPVPAFCLDLGPPISLERSPVLACTKFLAHDVQHVEEPLLSDLEVAEEDDDNEYSSDTYSDTESDTDDEDSVELDMDRCHNVRELQEEENASTKQKRILPGLATLPEPGGDRVEELTLQLREMENVIHQLQTELEKSKRPSPNVAETTKDEDSSLEPPHKGPRIETFRSRRSGDSDTSLRRTDGRRKSTHSDSAASLPSFERIDSVTELQVELQEEREKNAIFQREQDRLLSVVELLKGELEREPEMIDIVNELSEAKFALALERTEREGLENVIRQLRSSEEKKQDNAEKKKGLFFGYTPPWPKSPRSPARRSVLGESLTKAPSESFVSPRSILF